ncbi:MAG: alanine--tRNA ligase [Gammaproteobacteria bacterium]|nr:alanine--tRNA ligase [Gammaproteobacteria bacterium]
MTSNELRALFLNYFTKKQHTVVHSSSLIPANDPSLLFTNAGMVQFKEVFLGLEKRSYTRATSSQRCVRAGGKHNDLDNVGYTARHHTFFEMLGNFSFGDYFKEEAITYAWEFLTTVLKLPPERLWVTVYKEDTEAEAIWLNKIKIDPARFSRCDEDNFWAMGDTGPCGPSSEIFYDHGPEIVGGPPGSEGSEGDRYIEIWNLVFMQYNRDEQGHLTPLPKPSVDTGMGLERICAVMQGVHNNYDTDVFTYLIDAIAALGRIQDKTQASLRVVADHIRACTFLVTDGVVPSNEGQGYVLRRIIRRAIRHGNKLGFTEPFFHKLVKPLVEHMKGAYPELVKAQAHCERLLLQEENQFAKTLEQGLKILEDAIAKLKNDILPGELVFRLYDTYGFPADLTADIARERHLFVDTAGFEEAMEKQRQLSSMASKFSVVNAAGFHVETKTEFVGYEFIESEASVQGLFDEQQQVVDFLQGKGWVTLDKTPFYAESGGQVGDCGALIYAGGRFVVEESRKEKEAILHFGCVHGEPIKRGMKVSAQVEDVRRRDTACNHSATHLLHTALRQVLGEHANQKGSLVEAARLRFDYSHHEAPTQAQLCRVEDIVNECIRANVAVETAVMSQQAATAQGADAFFGDKYGDKVRVLRMGDFSLELCGGTHVGRTGDIGLFKIVSESSISSGIRRIEAITARQALCEVQARDALLQEMAILFKAKPEDILEKVEQIQLKNKQLEKEVERLTLALLTQQSQSLLAYAKEVAGHKIVIAQVEAMDAKLLRQWVENLRSQLSSGVVGLASVKEGKVNMVVAAAGVCIKRCGANAVVNYVASELGGKGGGKPELAQVGGNDPARLASALEKVKAWLINEVGQA